MKINNKDIGDDKPAYIIAELSANHLGKLDIALEMIKKANEIGADAVKIQTYTADTLTLNCSTSHFQVKQGTIWDGRSLYDLYNEAATPWEWQPILKEYADKLGITLFSSPFDKTAVDFLEELNVPAYKIASFEITDIPLIRYVASKGKPVIISTGIATLGDLEQAINTCHRVGNDQLALLKCTSEYPAPLEDVNLKTIPNLKQTFNTVVGISDHTIGYVVPIAGVALGAKIIEKHFILDRKMGGPDALFSLEPDEFRDMIIAVRDTEKALGNVSYELTDKIKRAREFSRSLFVSEDIRLGETFTELNIKSVRPGYGLHPSFIKDIIGKKARTDLSKGTPLSWDLID